MELNTLTTEELKVIALEKGKNGNATKRAYKAQNIIWDRAEHPYKPHNFINHKKYTSSDYSYLE